MKYHLIKFLIIILIFSCEKEENSDNTLLYFKIEGIDSNINSDENIITLTIPKDEVITSLKPIVELPIGASIFPDCNTPLDFSRPIEFIITAENGQTKRYAVNIVFFKSSECNITSFSIDNIECSVTNCIQINVYESTDLSNLLPKVELSEDAVIYPSCTEPLDFRKDIIFTVTSEDGTQQEYLVIVDTIQGLQEVNIDFLSSTYNGKIDYSKNTITFDLPYDYINANVNDNWIILNPVVLNQFTVNSSVGLTYYTWFFDNFCEMPILRDIWMKINFLRIYSVYQN